MRIASPPPEEHLERTRLRLTFLAALIATLLVLLVGRLWYLQVMVGERYVELAEHNRVRTISLEATRGQIFDRNGEPVVTNQFVNVVGVQLHEMGDRQGTVIADLADLLGVRPADLLERVERSTVGPYRPQPVAFDVPEDIVLYIWENQSTRYPGVYAELLPRREYPQGSVAAHVLGYAGEITAEQLEESEFAGYEAGTQVGHAGVERSYESLLHGVEGQRRLEINARGEVVEQLSEVVPKPGSDLRLTLDLEAQRLAEESIAEGIKVARRLSDPEERADGTFEAPAGAAVVLDPGNGEILALASYPTFEPSVFVGGISQDDFAELVDPEGDAPLINRAIQSSYPPGSVFKPVSAAAALRHGFMDADEQLPCPGSWRWNGQGGVYRNWTSADMGSMTLSESLTHSCDTVYYELAKRMWEQEERTDREHEFLGVEARRWGYGRSLEVDLSAEEDGVIPGRQWRRSFWEQMRPTYCAKAKTARDAYARQLFKELCSQQGATWRGGDAVNMSIGQGDVQATPLQVAVATAAVANGGTVWWPHVAREFVHPDGTVEPVQPRALRDVELDSSDLALIQRGLEGVTAAGGTAASVFADFPVDVAGKTGTAEIKPKQPFAWFTAYAPADDPRFVVVTMVEEGGGGSQTAAPIARRIFEGLLDLEVHAIDPGTATD